MIYIYNIIFISNQWSAQSHSKFDQNETRVPRAARFFSLPRSISPVTSPSHWNPTLATRFRLLQMLVLFMTAPAKSSLKLLQVLQRETESEIDSGQTLTWYVNDVFVATNEEIRSSAKYLFCQCFANVLPMFCQGTTEDQPNYMVADCSYPSKNYIMTACYRNHGSAQHHPATMKCAGDEGL